MHLLLIGGTRFVGRHTVQAALADGHQVTLFHRGRSGADLFPDCEHVIGDRDRSLSALTGRRFDAVIDTCGYLPAQLRASTRALVDDVEHYVFVSSMSVYADPRPGDDEDAPRATLGDGADDEVTPATYGALKALCEDEVAAAFGERATLVRPGLVVGPHDPTGRFTAWVRRCAAGGALLAPGPADLTLTCIDGRDLGAWLVACAERRLPGAWDAVGPCHTRRELIAACAVGTGAQVEPVWVDETFLLSQGVTPWSDLPLWIPAGDDGMFGMTAERARAAGLGSRPLEDTARETWAWARDAGDAAGPRFPPGLAPEREAALLAAWASQHR